jgi:Lon protease-like protein
VSCRCDNCLRGEDEVEIHHSCEDCLKDADSPRGLTAALRKALDLLEELPTSQEKVPSMAAASAHDLSHSYIELAASVELAKEVLLKAWSEEKLE